MTEKTITCITCPLGCDIVVRDEGDGISYMHGNQCKRGEEYARNEFVHPVRILTTTAKIECGETPLVPVCSDKPISRKLLMQCMEEIRKVILTAPVFMHDVIIPDILGTDVNIMATSEVRQKSYYIGSWF